MVFKFEIKNSQFKGDFVYIKDAVYCNKMQQKI